MKNLRGSPEWWQSIERAGAPLIEPINQDRVLVTFFWRDKDFSSLGQSPVNRVLVDINSVTDHHSETPQSLENIAGTDVWTWSIDLPAAWCGSYSFIPLDRDACFNANSPEWYGQNQDQAQRSWWISIQNRAIADPLNPLRPYRSGWGGMCSPLILPKAPRQPSWRNIDLPTKLFHNKTDTISEPKEIIWKDHKSRERRAWLWRSENTEHRLSMDGDPLVVLLDGRTWIEKFPLYEVLTQETVERHLLPATYLFIDQGTQQMRTEDLSCNMAFWNAVKKRLLPHVEKHIRTSANPKKRIIVGQSLGGLAALYAALCVPWEDMAGFGGILSQSGSFWWPESSVLGDGAQRPAPGGWLCRQPRPANTPPNSDDRISLFIEVGNREGAMIDVSDAMAESMRSAGHKIFRRQFAGGHDVLCWRHGLIDGLRWLIPPTSKHTVPSAQP